MDKGDIVGSSRWIKGLIVGVFVFSSLTYYKLFFTPKNSLELFQEIKFVADDFDDVRKLMLEGFEQNFKEEDYEYISRPGNSPKSISQFTLFEYDEKSFVIMTTPGTEILKVLAVEELPNNIRGFFLHLVD